MKYRFEREFESVVREIISEIDSTFYIEKELILYHFFLKVLKKMIIVCF
ncbi:hypothetical protein ACV3ZD_10425 [Clostridium perfringens]|uniref:Uncharacterized protein n=2 Tax=Clostridium perfringens TaxID=1502 RepID=A0AAP4EGW7_CLOPF|nr:hypothetical protein [Clostridium perfringens]EHK2357454.1 hypothetical protein [Clostridium perfringens]EJT6664594.1 hypothetical protein [Clostridium perfringens]MBO3345279.1 hypothetical protein [Clostridium perfringens]MBO3348352.1 hypothetical protein [Clostridium perfringens]MBO3353836.1 hypothetical protein [Clostridium perfringens]